jgi:tetratricopeptide repeat protein
VALVTVAVAVFGLRVIREGRGLLPLSLCVTLGLLIHRSALGLLPAMVMCSALAPRAEDPIVRWSRPRNWIAAVIPFVALATMLPRIAGAFATMDPLLFTPPEVVSSGGILTGMFAGARGADLLNVVGLLSPLALVLPIGLLGLGRWGVHAREGALLASLALPWVVMLMFVHPPQGLFRDWDYFAAGAVSLSLMTAWLISLAARGARGWAWLCVPAVLGCAAPSIQWLMHNTARIRGLDRIESYLREPPVRSGAERAKTWEFLGVRYAQLERWEHSAAAMAEAAAIAPSPGVLLQWAAAEQTSGNDHAAQTVYRRLIRVAPDETRAWYGLAYVSWRLGDLAESRRAAAGLLRLRPNDPQVRRIFEQVTRADAARAGAAR